LPYLLLSGEIAPSTGDIVNYVDGV